MSYILTLKVKPNSAHGRISLEAGRIVVHVTVVPEGGKANKAVLELLSKTFKMPKSSFDIIGGLHHSEKRIKVHPDRVSDLLQSYLDSQRF